MAYTEELEADLSAAQEREDRLRAWLVAGISSAASFLIFALWVLPVNEATLHTSRLLGCLAALPAVASIQAVIFCTVLAKTRKRERLQRQLVKAGVVLPIAGIVWGAVIFDDHAEFRRMLGVFDSYTHRFPRDYFGDAHIVSTRIDDYGTVCARTRRGDDFCIEVDGSAPTGRRVVGGYRVAADDYERFEPYGCFGSALACEIAEPG